MLIVKVQHIFFLNTDFNFTVKYLGTNVDLDEMEFCAQKKLFWYLKATIPAFVEMNILK